MHTSANNYAFSSNRDKEETSFVEEYSYLYGLMPLMPPMPCAYFESNFDALKNAVCRCEISQ